jgi:transcription initiation factor TFIIIB Brf1 subunit/transcription initiation factor TFIIB
VSRSEKTLIEALENIHTMADRMNLGRTLVDRAYQRFEEVQIGNHLKGHSTDLIAATTLHIACRWVENIELLI